MSDRVLIIPVNDPEAVQIWRIAKAMGLPVIRSRQGHGATLDKEKELLKRVKASGHKRVVVVEMPGPKAEESLRRAGFDVVIIDHHEYTGLDRARNPKTGRRLRSSLEQFRSLFRITDKKLKALGFDPRLVRAIGIQDRGYVWALLKEGYAWKDIRGIFEHMDRLMDEVRDPGKEQEKMAQAQRAWDKREAWNGYFIVHGDGTGNLRVRLSRIAALAMRKPTPIIVVEADRGFIYVQESDAAEKLFNRFGGFTFGMGRAWGHKNSGTKHPVTLEMVQAFLAEHSPDALRGRGPDFQ
ncbi:hypothetical protein EPO34_03020 [Patescibacteria group bacterium]|nr:MAG: hypothetical protein EPO34_03020 [Patescibacteria group bacterium]